MRRNPKMIKKHQPPPAPSLAGYVWIFTGISFLGWCFEKLGRWYLYPTDVIRDRGFLTLPFCGIYGTCMVVIGFLLGSPDLPSAFGRWILGLCERLPRRLRAPLGIFGYFLAVTLVATLIELAVGLPFELAGEPLWNYHDRWGNLWGVICPTYSILWGLLATVFMSAVWKPICFLVGRVPERTLRIGAILMVAVLLCDFAWSLIYMILTGTRFYFL